MSYCIVSYRNECTTCRRQGNIARQPSSYTKVKPEHISMEIKGKIALVTGGASGIGLACVRELLREGAKVALCDLESARAKEALKHVQDEFGTENVIFIKTDVTSAEEFEDAFKTTIKTFKSLDIVLNNAGIFDDTNWKNMIDVNLGAVVQGVHLSFQYMGKQDGGRGGIVCNTASVLGLRPMPVTPIYCATKHAIIGLTRSYGSQYHCSKTGVKVVAVCPGVTNTLLLRNTMTDKQQDVEFMTELQRNMVGDIEQQPENVAAGVMVLLRTAANGSIWVSENSGQAFEVNIPSYRDLRKP